MLVGALESQNQGLIVPVLIGPKAKIVAASDAAKRSLEGIELIDVPHSHAAAEQAVKLVRKGAVEAIMKGKLHTDELMDAITDQAHGLRTERRMSHIFALDVPHYPKPLFITDAAINIYPDLDEKRDIVQNSVDLVQALNIFRPKVAILDGPLAFDNAISKSAAEAKDIVSEVAGEADILIAPDLEAGNMIAKQLIYLAGAESAGIVLGARVPIILTSRADGTLSRLASCALAQLYIDHTR